MLRTWLILVCYLFIHTINAQLSCGPGNYCPSDLVTVQNATAYQVAYYSAFPTSRLADDSGVTGPLTDTGTTSLPYQSDGPWSGSEAYVFNGNQQFTTPSITLGNTPYTICLWAYYSSVSTWACIFSCAHITFYTYTNGVESRVKFVNSYAYTPYFGANNWGYLCIGVLKDSTFSINSNVYNANGGYPFTMSTMTGTCVFGSGGGFGTLTGYMDEVRIFKKYISSSEQAALQNYRFYPCPAGSFTELSWQKTCTPCPASTYQPYPGQNYCLQCTGTSNPYDTLPGSIACPSTSDYEQCLIGPKYWLTATTTPGTAMLQVSANYVSLNCPSGTYSTTVSTLSRLTDNCAIAGYGASCPASGCCVWVSSFGYNFQLMNVAGLFDGMIQFSLSLSFHAGCFTNDFIAIDFGASTYVDSILSFDRTGGANGASGNCARSNNLRVFIGNSLKGSRQSGTTTQTLAYPITDTANTLCFQGGTVDQGYRNPGWISCQTSGRYLYIVADSTKCLHPLELIITSTPPCTRCAAGTYSINNQANTLCTECPVNTYQPSTGQSTCIACPANTWQPNTSSTYCVPNVPAGSYASYAYHPNLIRYFPLIQPNPYQDVMNGFTSLTSVTGYSTTNGPWSSAPYITSASTTTASVNFGALQASNGFSVCLWVNFLIMESYQKPLVCIATAYVQEIDLQRSSTSTTFQWQIFDTSQYSGVTFTFSKLASWGHICVTANSAFLYTSYVDGVLVGTATQTKTMPNVVMPSCTIGSSANTQVSDFRIYNKALSATEIASLYASPIAIPCPIGSFTGTTNQVTCTPCAPQTYQDEVGKSLCKICSEAKWYATNNCAGTFPKTADVAQTTTTTAGQALVVLNGYSMSMNCPSGTYSPTVYNVPVMTSSGCSTTCGAACCYWMTTQFSTNDITFAFNGDTKANVRTFLGGGTTGSWISIDLYSTQYIDTILILDQSGSEAQYMNGLAVLVGSQSVLCNGAQALGSGCSYPFSTTTNTLCAITSTTMYGYRNPWVVRCATSGRYIYLAQTGSTGGAFREIIVSSQPVCNLCAPGTFSYNTIPTVKCAQCPAGTYQSGLGKSYCDSCATSTYSTGVGMTTSDACVSINTNLIAYYTFAPGQRLTDLSTLGTLTQLGDNAYAADGPWKGSQYSLLGSNGYFSLPSVNFGSYYNSGGFSICMWYMMTALGVDSLYYVTYGGTTTNLIDIHRYTTTNVLAVVIYTSATLNIIYGTTPIALNVWRHICYVMDKTSSTASLYENGVKTTSATIAAPSAGASTTNRFACYNAGMDEVRIYGSTLSAAQVLAIYNYRNYQCPSTANCRTGNYCPTRLDSSCANLIAYYGFWGDNPTLDASGVTGSATLPGGTQNPTFATASGPWTGAPYVSFLSTSQQYLSLPSLNMGALSAANGFTVCTWYYPINTAQSSRLFDFANGQNINNVLIHLPDNPRRVEFWHAIGTTNSYAVKDISDVVNNAWNHVCVTAQGSPAVMSIYTNGVFHVTGTSSIAIENVLLTKMLLGHSNWGPAYDIFSNMYQAEFRIYNKALSANEVLDIYNFRSFTCPAGSYCPDGSTQPIPCPRNTYQDATGQTSCKACPVNKYTSAPGAQTSSLCVECA